MSRGVVHEPVITQVGGVAIATPTKIVAVAAVLEAVVNMQSGTITVTPDLPTS